MNETIVERVIAGKKVILKSGFLAKQAGGAVHALLENTEVLGLATMSSQVSTQSFFPLSVDYIEKFYAGGKVPGSYNRREGRPTDHEILTSRLIDRPIRPLFANGFRNEVQVIVNVLGIDGVNPSDVIAMTAASAALTISDIPFKKSVAGVRVGLIEGEIIVNPTVEQINDEKLELDLLVAGTDQAITMIEGNAQELSEEKVLEAIERAHEVIKELIELQLELKEKVGKEKISVELYQFDETLVAKLRNEFYEEVKKAFETTEKLVRQDAIKAIYTKAEANYAEEDEKLKKQVGGIIHDFEAEVVRTKILKENQRPDGRSMDELRGIDCKVGYLKNTHGSSVFTRGQTQSLGVVTLGSPRDKQRVDLVSGFINKSFFLHYNFPPYSVGETGRIGATGRREIGHGMLAERSLIPVMPKQEDFDFTIRLVSEILESNGSSSMATICSGSMALMEAGVPIKSHVAGIAMGLIIGDDGNYKILTDIQGLEDHLGDMDFKVAGTREGITGFQLDIKVEGITIEIMKKALEQASRARMTILGKMEEQISSPENSKENAPKRETIKIPVDKIKSLIGMGGKNIKAIVEETGSDVDIQDSGEVNVFSGSEEILARTKSLIESYTGSPKVGAKYDGTVKRVVPFGAFVEIFPGVDGLCHISEFSDSYVGDINEVVKEGQKLTVVVKAVDDQGKIKLSRKNLDEEN